MHASSPITPSDESVRTSDIRPREGTSSARAIETVEQEKLLAQLNRLRGNAVRPAEGAIKHPYCIPGGFYQQQWDWDGFFISAHLAARTPPRAEYLKYWTLNVLASELPDGEVASCITADGPRLAHPSLLLKPFLAQGAELAGRLLDDDAWLESCYESVVRLATRREATHLHPDCGLFAWDDAMQSGADNNPAIGNDLSTKGTRAACDLNAFFHREYLALTRIAGRLGRTDDEARFARMASGLHAAVNTHLWNSETQSYWNLDLRTQKPIQRVSYSNFVPLWAGMATPHQAEAMIERYLWNEDHMLSPFGLRSLSREDPDYNNASIILPYSNWQGPVWPIANYFYFVGLMKYGFHDQARDLVGRLTRLYLSDIDFCGSLHENYHAETGRPLAPSADQSKDGREGGFVGWNLLLQDMIEMLDGRPHLLELQG